MTPRTGGALAIAPVEPGAPRLPAVRSLAELAGDPSIMAPAAWVLNQFFERGSLNSVFGIAKGGKSTMLQDIAVHVATGRAWAGYDVTRGTVLWVDLEQGARRLLRNFALVDRWRDASILTVCELDRPLAVSDLRQLMAAHAPDLVIIDSLAKLCRVEDENDNGAWQRALQPLEALARSSSAAVVVIDHDRKGEGEYGRGMRGASSKLAAFDTAVHVRRKNGGVRSLEVVSREVGDFRVDVERTEGGYRVPGSRDDVVLLALQSLEEPIRVEALHEHLQRQGLQVHINTVRGRLKALVTAGTVQQTGTGAKGAPHLYSATDVGELT